MIPKLLVIGIAFMTMGTALFAGESGAALSDAQFEKALRNISTGPNYVLVGIVDKSNRDGEVKWVCLEGMALVTQLQSEHGFTHADGPFEQAIQFALAQEDRSYEFSERVPQRDYTDTMLEEVRQFLSGRTEEDIRALASDQQSPLYTRFSKEPGSLVRFFPAIAHVLSERGVLCGRSCKPGLLYVEKTKDIKAQ